LASLRRGPAVGTIVATNYLPHARVLAGSLQIHNPATPFFVVVIDDDGQARSHSPSGHGLETIPLSRLGIPLDRCRFTSRPPQEAAVLAKPFLLQHLLDCGYQSAIFLDPDTLIVGALDSVFDAVAAHAVVLTPHLLAPLDDANRVARELNILQAGTLNAGFVGVSDKADARVMLTWWQDRLMAACSHAVADGIYYDQRWLDLAALMFDDVHLLRDPGSNVAYWNLPERAVSIRGEEVLVDGVPARFFHFSGFDPVNREWLSKYASHRVEHAGAAAAIYHRYAELLLAAGHGGEASRHVIRWQTRSGE
jgi:hypothetical protein